MLREIPVLVDELAGGGLVMRDRMGVDWLLVDEHGKPQRQPVGVYGPAPATLAAKEPDHPLVQRAGRPVEHRDLVANVLPAGPIGGSGRGGRVSGSAEPRLPINVDRTDLLAAPRGRTSASAPLAYPEQDGDQVGFLPVAATLDGLAEGLRLHRGAGERRPFPAVTSLCTWLLKRLDDACNDWPGIGEFFDEVRHAHDALRGQAGRIDIPDYKAGVPCSKCGHLTLLRHGGRDYVECASCPYALTIPEYERYVSTLSTMLGTEERERRKKVAADRRAMVRLLREMHAVGWRCTRPPTSDEAPVDGDETRAVRWERPGESIDLTMLGDWGCLYYSQVDAAVVLSVEWLAPVSARWLRSVCSAAGVLALPKERAA